MGANTGLVDGWTRGAVGLSITGYQRYVSPYKGFRCAHRALHGGESCSAYGKRAIQEVGVRAGMALLRERFAERRAANTTLLASHMDNGTDTAVIEPEAEQPEPQTKPQRKRPYSCGHDVTSGTADAYGELACLPFNGCTPDTHCDCGPCDFAPCGS